MEELEAMKAKKQELLERNNRLKENQDKPVREYSNSVTRTNVTNSAAATDSAGLNVSRKNTATISASSSINLTNAKNQTSPSILVQDEIKEVNAAEEENKVEEQMDEVKELDEQIDKMVIKHEPGKLDLAFD